MNNNLKCKVISKNMEREFQVDIRKIQMLNVYEGIMPIETIINSNKNVS